jgi:hypothetical protein
MSGLAFRTAIVSASAIVALTASPAFAANASATQILPQLGSPVQIDMCSFTYLSADPRLTAHVDIKNTGEKLVNDVEFFFVTRLRRSRALFYLMPSAERSTWSRSRVGSICGSMCKSVALRPT